MKTKGFIRSIFCLALIIPGCSKDNPVSQDQTQGAWMSAQSGDKSALLTDNEGTQITGIGYYADPSECDPASEGAAFTLKLTGDLEGCIYGFIDKSECAGGYYWEEGREHFVGTYKGEPGEYWTTYRFLAKYEGCADGATFSGAEIMGFCDHPFVAGSGTGAFKGITGGRYYMIDKVRAVPFKAPYRGNVKF